MDPKTPNTFTSLQVLQTINTCQSYNSKHILVQKHTQKQKKTRTTITTTTTTTTTTAATTTTHPSSFIGLGLLQLNEPNKNI
jgi:hypothetical protein